MTSVSESALLVSSTYSSLTFTFPLDMRDKNNQTPLHKSCGSWRNTGVVVKYLVENTNCDISE